MNTTSEPARPRRAQVGEQIGAAALAVFLAASIVVLGLHLAMLPQGQWHDEFYTFSYLRAQGLHGALTRLVNWGPRPFSELLILVYWHAVRLSGAPLMGWVLGACWAMMWAGLLGAIRPWQRPGRGARWALALGLPALLLMAGPVAELWYWPVGALAYMPALGAACYATLALAGPGVAGRRDWAWLAAILSLGAWSVELGMFLAALLSPMLAVSAWHRDRREAAIMMVPLAASLLVAVGLAHGRTAQVNEMVDAGTFHRVWPSLRAGWSVFAPGLMGVGEDGGTRVILVRLLLLLGAWFGLQTAWRKPVSRLRLVMAIVALAGTALLSAAGAFYQFGVLCCERHEAYRQALYLLIVVASAGLLPRRAGAMGRYALAAPALLAGAVLLACPGRVADLRAEYRLAGVQEAADAAMFRSGADPAADTLDVFLAPPGPLLEGSHTVPGDYSMASNPPWYVKGPMMYFSKSRMRVRQGWVDRAGPPRPPVGDKVSP